MGNLTTISCTTTNELIIYIDYNANEYLIVIFYYQSLFSAIFVSCATPPPTPLPANKYTFVC
jgi:hypothetical protein